jgi:hypothetical protein
MAAQETGSGTPASEEGAETAPRTIPPKPTMGWVLDGNAATIAPAFGDASLLSAGAGSSPPVAQDGAGNIDGEALVGGSLNGQPVSHYALKSTSLPSLSAGTTVLLLCGRENNWLASESGGLLPVEARGAWSVTKPGEWGLGLASSESPFAVVSGGNWVYANAPPPPAGFAAFNLKSGFPPAQTNAPVCVWGLYDTSVMGSPSAPEISVAYDDGAASPPVKLKGPVLSRPDPMEVLLGRLGADLGTLFVWQDAAAEPFFQQPVRAAWWNGGLHSSITSGFKTPGWFKLAVTALDPRPIALGGDAQDNVWAVSYASFVRTSPFAHYSITTSPGTPFLAVRYAVGNAKGQPYLYSVSFELDGQYLGYDQPWQFGANLRSIPLPQDGRSHSVELRNGFAENNGDYAKPTLGSFGGGGYIDAVAVLPGYMVKVNRPAAESVALVLSHSVAVGDESGQVPAMGQGAQSSIAWTVQARAGNAFGTSNVMVESYGGELLANDCWTQAACNAYLAAIKAAQPHIAVGFAARMLNDFYHGRLSFGECLPQYERTLQYLFDAWQTEFPGVPLYVGSDIRESAVNEALTDGCTPPLKLADWRSGIESTVQAYAGSKDATWLHFVDMSQWVPQSDLIMNGIHPTVAGQVKICQTVSRLFNQPDSCRVPR